MTNLAATDDLPRKLCSGDCRASTLAAQVDVAPAPNSAQRVLTYDAQSDEAEWEGTVIRRSDPIPE